MFKGRHIYKYSVVIIQQPQHQLYFKDEPGSQWITNFMGPTQTHMDGYLSVFHHCQLYYSSVFFPDWLLCHRLAPPQCKSNICSLRIPGSEPKTGGTQ
jgi:hypothetical protein